MTRLLQVMVMAAATAMLATNASARIIIDPGGGDDGGGGGGGGSGSGGGTTPPPPFQYIAQNSDSIGNSTVGAAYNAALQAYADGARQNVMARGYASSWATLLGNQVNLVIVNGMVNANASTFGTQVSVYLLGHDVEDYSDSFTTAFSKTFSDKLYQDKFWQYESSWTFLGTGVDIQLALDGTAIVNGAAAAGPLYANGSLNPHLTIDLGGTLSVQFLWMTAGSLTGIIHLVDAQASGNAAIDARPLLSGQPGTWTVSGSGQLCSGGGSISGCVAFVGCAQLAGWDNYCPGWLSLSGSTSGTF
jgi:hypothetical protein